MNKPETDKEILAAFADLLDEVPLKTPDEIQTILTDAGIDLNALAIETEKLVQEGLSNSPYNWRNKQSTLDKVKTNLSHNSLIESLSRAEIIKAIQGILVRPETKLATAHFRNQNFSEMSDEELKSLYEELAYLAESDE